MKFHNPFWLALVALAGLAASEAVAQPIAPPRRPTFSSYSSLYTPGSGYFGYGYGGPSAGGPNLYATANGGLAVGLGGYGYGGFGWGGPGAGFGALAQQQNLQLQQQLTAVNQNIASLQNAINGSVNPNFPITGRGATFNYLGHWYSGGTGGTTGGFNGFSGGLGAGSVMGSNLGRTAGIGYPTPSQASAAPGGAAPANNNAPRTAGTGFPVGPRK
jgi:hypothetical protein